MRAARELRTVDAIRQHINTAYREKTGREATLFTARPAEGE